MDLEKYFYEHLEALQELIRIPSVFDVATVTQDAPYGKGVAAALEYMRQLAFQDGFEVLSYDGHAIGIQIKEQAGSECYDEAMERIDVASHLDVVEPGDGWSEDPFGAVIRDGKLFGRGSQDMKTSAFLTYLALKKLKEEGISFRRKLRIVLGCDEERTMDDMIYYLKKAGRPAFAFTPDGTFPMSIGEKGALMWRITGHYEGVVEEISCGVQCNVVSPEAEARLNRWKLEELVELVKRTDLAERVALTDQASLTDWFNQVCKEAGIDGVLRQEEESIIIRVKGKAAHASKPWDGHSATTDLFYLLGKLDPFLKNLYQCFYDPYGSQLGILEKNWDAIPSKKEEETQYTMNLGVFRIKNGECYGEVDARYPFGMDSADLTERLAKKCALHVSLDYDSPPIMNDVNDIFVSCLLETYREQTGDSSEPAVSGGVSYSKVFEHCVAYGPIGPWAESLVHQADESIRLEDCVKAFTIYYEAMKKLALL